MKERLRKMKNLMMLEKYRVELYGINTTGDSGNGAFKIPIDGKTFGVIASDGGGWDHVSVSHRNRIPTWEEMCKVKELFFEDDEVAMQLHPAKKDYINIHPNCLHLWRPQNQDIPLPPKIMV